MAEDIWLNDALQSDPNRWEVIVKYHGDLVAIGRAIGAEVEILYDGYAIITLEKSAIPKLLTYPEVEHIELPKRLSIEASFDLTSSCITSVQDRNSFGLTGQGVLVAIIDSGIDYTHPDFLRSDGTSRVLYLWDQTVEGTPPAGFFGGTEYTNAQLNAALAQEAPYQVVPSKDTNGHGTAVAGIAAGNGSRAETLGVAPDAELLVVKIGLRGFGSFARTTEIMRAVKYVIDRAEQLGRPVAVNLSLGMNNGSHLGDSVFETYLSDVSSRWKSVFVVPTGNEGTAGHHYQGTIATNEIREIDFFTANGLSGFFVSLWKHFEDNFSIEVVFPNGKSSGIVGIESQVKTVRESGFVATIFYGQPSRYTVQQELRVEVQATDGGVLNAGLWKIRLRANRIVEGSFDIWLPTLEEVTAKTFFSVASDLATLTIPSTAARVVRVAGYHNRVGSIADFSGRGYANLALPGPDLAAPAVNITSAAAGGGYSTFTGTSMAAPFVTGAAALMMQWGIVQGNDPFLYGERVKAFLRIGAARKAGTSYPNPSSGYGTLCLENTMRTLVDYRLGSYDIWSTL